jgi:hypothetical protein
MLKCDLWVFKRLSFVARLRLTDDSAGNNGVEQEGLRTYGSYNNKKSGFKGLVSEDKLSLEIWYCTKPAPQK